MTPLLHPTCSQESIDHLERHGYAVVVRAGLQPRIARLVADNRHRTDDELAQLITELVEGKQ